MLPSLVILALGQPHSGPGYSRLATAEDDFALADQLLVADDDDDVEPSNI